MDTPLTLFHIATRTPIGLIRVPVSNGIIIGRTDANSDFIPDLDLAPFEAREAGVSRRHAALVRYHDQLHIIDLNSANGTFINGRRLRSDIPYRLVEGDTVQFGTLVLKVTLGDA